MPGDFAGRDAIVPALDVIARELAPPVATFFTVGGDGKIQSSVVHGSHRPPAELAQEVQSWEVRLRGIDPLAPATLAELSVPIATLGHVGGAKRAVLDNEGVRETYEQLGVVNDVRLLIRDGDRLVAGVTLWRQLRGRTWTSGQLGTLAALQPLIEMAYLSTVRAASNVDARLPDTLTGRQREVARLLATGATNREIARALYISPDTAKSHTRAVLSKLGVTSRREMVMRFTHAAAERSSDTATGGPATGNPPGTRWAARPPASERSVRLEGDAAPQRLLTAVLDWAAEHVGATIGGCALFSERLELVAQAWGSARSGDHEPDPRLARRVHRQLLPPTQPSEVARYLDADPAQSPVVQLDASKPPGGDEQFGELVAGLGLTPPLLAVLRLQGHVAALIWLCHEGGADVDERESAHELRSVQPLLELTNVPRLADSRSRMSTPEQLADFGLTPREIAVARLALQGQSNAAIASRLGISKSTVKNHISRILKKCGVRSRTHLIALLSDTPDGD